MPLCKLLNPGTELTAAKAPPPPPPPPKTAVLVSKPKPRPLGKPLGRSKRLLLPPSPLMLPAAENDLDCKILRIKDRMREVVSPSTLLGA
ncbi:hypothetical protein A1Q2_06369 [Trichosporon asahii var. asahii CBS 8904]|uniref:Uncharacterized protein n=1 Tax=Trichosporon asahii var. asahii (strain CBS 8904) TaxID=1220162 RepID=K1VRW6_TRIAC|nr:hypothetical protein A1Q2_06369 [Trichosporon asahii var. asahii CBS 8904]